jgi:hypothetical protein
MHKCSVCVEGKFVWGIHTIENKISVVMCKTWLVRYGTLVQNAGKWIWKRESPHKVRNLVQVRKMAKNNEIFSAFKSMVEHKTK